MSVILPNKILQGIPGVEESDNSVARFVGGVTIAGSSNVFINDNGELSIGKAIQENNIELSITQRSASIEGLRITGAEDRSMPLIQLLEGSGIPAEDLIQIAKPKFVINKDGKVGIGTSFPQAIFDITNNSMTKIVIADDNTFSSGISRMNTISFRANNPNNSLVVESAAFGAVITPITGYTFPQGYLTFWTRDHSIGFGERMRITTTGYIGINEQSPETLLEMTHALPFVTLHCDTNSDAQDSGKCELRFKRQRSGVEESTHAKIVAAHNGILDDEIGYIGLNINSGAEGDSPTERMKITSDLLESKTDMIFSGSGTGFPYGCIAGDNETITCTLQDTYYQVTFDTIGCENLITGSIDNNDMAIQKTGIYRMTANISFHSAVAHDFEFQIKKNDGASDIPHAHSYQTTMVANQVEHTSIGPIPCSLTIDDVLELWVRCTDASGIDCIIDHVNLCTDMVGG